MIWFPSCLDAQLCVSSVNNNGLSTQPWGDPVQLGCYFWHGQTEVSWIQKHVVVFMLSRRRFSISLWGVMVLNAELKSTWRILSSVQMSEDWVQSGGYCILCGADAIRKLVWVMWCREAGCDEWPLKPLKRINHNWCCSDRIQEYKRIQNKQIQTSDVIFDWFKADIWYFRGVYFLISHQNALKWFEVHYKVAYYQSEVKLLSGNRGFSFNRKTEFRGNTTQICHFRVI